MESLGRILVILGLVAAAAGGVLLILAKAGVGSLPGDFSFGRGNWKVYVPIGTSILLSVILTVVLSLLSRFR